MNGLFFKLFPSKILPTTTILFTVFLFIRTIFHLLYFFHKKIFTLVETLRNLFVREIICGPLPILRKKKLHRTGFSFQKKRVRFGICILLAWSTTPHVSDCRVETNPKSSARRSRRPWTRAGTTWSISARRRRCPSPEASSWSRCHRAAGAGRSEARSARSCRAACRAPITIRWWARSWRWQRPCPPSATPWTQAATATSPPPAAAATSTCYMYVMYYIHMFQQSPYTIYNIIWIKFHPHSVFFLANNNWICTYTTKDPAWVICRFRPIP